MLFFQLPWAPEWWLDTANSGAGVVNIWNRWGVQNISYDHNQLDSVLETFSKPGVTKAAVDWYRMNIPGAAFPWNENLRTSYKICKMPIKIPTLAISGK
jgi:hypothetical protein